MNTTATIFGVSILTEISKSLRTPVSYRITQRIVWIYLTVKAINVLLYVSFRRKMQPQNEREYGQNERKGSRSPYYCG